MKNLFLLVAFTLLTLGASGQNNLFEIGPGQGRDVTINQAALLQVQQQFDLATPVAPAVQSQLAALVQVTQQMQRMGDPRKTAAEEVALRSGMPLRTTLPDGRVAEVARLSPTGMVMYYITNNLNAAATTSVDKVWPGGSAGLSLAGSGMMLGEWDGGAVRLTHQEFPSGAVTQVDGSTTVSDHATHVAGTMVARGIQANAKGMAYQATLAAYDWTNDETEMMAAGANGMLVSNHSYGLITGFAWGNWSGTTGWHWTSNPDETEDVNFGRYSDQAQEWDAIANNRPNYLIIKSAGNDRGDGPAPGASYFHQVWNGSAWVWQSTTMARQLDGGSTGYDCISHAAVAKNVLTVGAVNGIAGGYSNAGQVVMSSFSGWGPTDDGRIKPDIVGKGVSVYSPITGTNNSSYDTYNGTSMASPNVSGGLILLQQHYKNLNSNQTMNASTLKALVLHTADEAGLHPGPDYVHGWGLMNVKKATDVIGNVGGKHAMIATTLSNSQTYTYQVNSNGTEPLRATIVWNDPAGVVPAYVLNGTTPALVRDLDVRIIRNSDNAIFNPWILNPANRTAAATTGDNVRDNVEQVLLANPVAGTYTVRVTHKGTLATPQAFSLIVSGVAATTTQVTFRVDMTGQTVSGQGVRIMGNFQGFSPSATSMTQVGSTQIYSYVGTFNIGDTIQYRFVNGNTTGQAETAPAGCRYLTTANRWVVVGANPTTLPAFLFGQCNGAVQLSLQFLAAPAHNNSLSPTRSPNGTSDHNFLRAAMIVPATEFAAAGIANGRSIQAIGMTYHTAGNTAVTGNLKMYYLNTTNTSYSRGGTFTSIINGMTLVYDSILTLPTTGGGWAINLQTPVTYTGNGAYLAYEWTTTSTPATVSINYKANALITSSCVSASSTSSMPLSLSATNFRPEIRWGFQRLNNELEVLTLFGLGKNPKDLGAGELFQAVVRNNGTTAATNASITLNMTGANTVNQTKQFSLGVDSTIVVNFDPFTAANIGTSTISATLTSDGLNANNSKSWTQDITDSVYARSYGNSGNNSVGWNTGAGLILTRFKATGQTSVRSVRIFIANHSGNAGNTVNAVVTSATGTLLATSPGLTLTTAHYNTWQTFQFSTPVPISDQEFMVGLRQPANTTGYYPVGAQMIDITPANSYYSTGLAGGGTLFPLNGFRLMMEAHMSQPVVQTTANVTFQVDMTGRQVSGNGVHIAGSFQGWNPATTPMTRVGTSQIYTYTTALPIGDTIEYKFVNGRNWGGYDSINQVPVDSSEFVPASCARPGTVNRYLIVPAQAVVLPVFGFGSCSFTGTMLNETFANGIPASWTNTGTAGGVTNPNARFEYRGPATTPNNTVGSRGAYNNGRGPLQSPTVSNGFVILDSDWLDNNGTGVQGTGIAPGQHVVSLTSPSFSTIGMNALTLKFNQSYRRFAGPGGLQTNPATFLVFSKDDGISWPDTVIINSQVLVNAIPDSTSQIQLNVGQFLGNSATARIQFLYDGFYYNWMLDDISVSGTAAHDLAMLNPTTTINGNPRFYGMVPLSQLDSLRFSAQAYNAGADAQANIGLRAQVFRNGQSVWTEFNSNGGAVLQPGDTTVVAVNQPPYLPNQAGNYRVALEVTNFQTDSYPANNRDTLNFLVTDSVMALDNGGFAAGAIGTNTFGAGNQDGMMVANFYHVRPNTELSSATVRFAATSVPGASVRFRVFSALNLSGSTSLAESDYHTVTAADIANGLTLSFMGPASSRTLPAMVPLYLAIELYSNGGANHIRVLDQISVPASLDASITYLPAFSNWFNNGNAYVLRLNVKQGVAPVCSTSIITAGLNANNEVVVCSGVAAVLQAPVDPLATFQWYRNGLPINWSSTNGLLVNVSGHYHVVKNAPNCTAFSDTIKVTVANPPVATINAGGQLFYAAGSTIQTTLTAGPQSTLKLGTQQAGGGIDVPYFLADSLNGWILQAISPTFAADMVVARDASAEDSLLCGAAINGAQLAGKIAIIYRGICEFGTKALAAQQAGAIAVIIINNIENNSPPLLGSGLVGNQLTIPVLSVSLETGVLIRQLIQAGQAGAALAPAQSTSFNYQWYRDGVMLANATQINYLATQTGDYMVEMRAGNYCPSSSQPVTIRRSVFQQTPWQIQQLNQPAANLTTASIHAVDSQVVWSLSYTPDGLAFPVTFFRTTNGGTTWTSGSIPGTEGMGTSSIVAVDANKAWVTLFGDSARQGIYHTTNGGVSWARQATAFNNNGFPNVTRFFNANLGVSMGDMAGGYLEIYTTTNGGQLWTRVPQANLPAFTDPQTAGMVNEAQIVGNTIYYPLNNGNYIKSTNFGLNWTQTFTQVSGQMRLAVADSAYAVSFGSNGALNYSNNNGTNWVSMTYPAGVGFINAMTFIPGASTPTLMVSGNLGTAFTTNFSGWEYIDSVYHFGLNFISPRHGWSGGLSITGNQQGMYRWNSNYFGSTTPPPTGQARVYGTLRYDNSSLTPISNALVTIRRSPTMEFVDSVRTNLMGQYLSAPLSPGSYSVTASTAKSWGGGNATDALLISRHFANLDPLSSLPLVVADVNASSQVNNTDALLVSQRFIGAISSFAAGDWHFTSTSFGLNAGDSSMVNISSLCYGDVNASYVPTGNARESSQVVLKTDEPVQLSTSQFTEVLVEVQQAYTIGAMSLVLQLPQGVSLEDVSLVPAHSQGLSYRRNGQELRISWFSLQPLQLAAGEPLLKLRFLNGTLPVGQHGIQIAAASEIADANGQLIAGATLVIPQLVGVYEADLNKLLQLVAYPNPFGQSTQLQLQLPEAGHLEVEIRDLRGRLVQALDLGLQSAGQQQVLLERAQLHSGVYFATVKLQSAENRYIRILRLIAE